MRRVPYKWRVAIVFLIGLFMAKGAPLLWQGMELCENYDVPGTGMGRVRVFRPMRWAYFYDEAGRHTIGLIRRLAALRKAGSQFRRGGHYFHNHYDHYQSKSVMLFSRQDAAAFSLIALNFSDAEEVVPFTFPLAGDYREELHGLDNLAGVRAGETRNLTIPSNYGRIWTVPLP